MKNTKFKVNALIYILSSVLNLSIPFILLPILTRELGAEEYGKIGLFQTFIALFVSLSSLGTTSFAMREFFESKKRAFKAARTIILISICACFISIILIMSLNGVLDFGLEVKYVIIAALCAFFSLANIVRQTIFQASHNAMKYAIFQVSQALISFILTLLLLYCLFVTAESRIYAILIVLLFYAIYSVISIYIESRSYLLESIRVKDFQRALKFGIPLIPHLFGAFCLSYLDRFLIVKWLDFEQLGYYLIAVQLSTLLGFLLDSIQKSYVPYVYGKIQENQITPNFLFMSALYMAGLSVFPLLFLLLGEYIVSIYIGAGFSSVTEILFFLILGQVFRGWYLIFSGYISYFKKNALQSFLTVFSGTINIILMYFFIKAYGVIGAAYSNVLAMFLLFILTALSSVKFIRKALNGNN